jgi:hypothetical protein
MRRSSSRSIDAGIALALMALALASCGGGGGVQISLQLKPGSVTTNGTTTVFDTSALTSLDVLLASAGKSEEDPLVLDASEQVAIKPKTVDSHAPIHIEVLGCEDAACSKGAATFRGCTLEDLDFSQRQGPQEVTIEMFPLASAPAGCGPL